MPVALERPEEVTMVIRGAQRVFVTVAPLVLVALSGCSAGDLSDDSAGEAYRHHPRCGDGVCNGSETCSSCPGDCGACAPSCGDGICSGSETCSSCPGDCGLCPDAGVDSGNATPAVNLAPSPLAFPDQAVG